MKISVIGAGAMGGAMVEGLLNGDYVANADICVSDPSRSQLERFADSGANITTENHMAAIGGDIIVVAVKPWIVESVLRGIRDVIDPTHQIVVIIAAGVSSDQLRQWLQHDGKMPQTLLAIPNIAIAQAQSMTFLTPVEADADSTAVVKRLFDSMGQTIVTDERLLAAGTTLASCGIAYAMRYLRAATEGGVELGFRAADAQRIVMQTMQGAVTLLADTGMHPEQAIDMVTTPGGLTIKGLNTMERAGFSTAVIQGLKAAIDG